MDERAFDGLTRALGRRRTRRGTARLLAAAALATLGVRPAARALAQNQGTCIPSKQACETTEQCCRGACVGSICDSTCSETGAICETDFDCCSSLVCREGDVKIPKCRPESCQAAGASCLDGSDCCDGMICGCSGGGTGCASPVCLAPGGATPISEPPGGNDSGGSSAGSDGGSTSEPPQTTLPATGTAPSDGNNRRLEAIVGGVLAASGALAAALGLRRSRMNGH